MSPPTSAPRRKNTLFCPRCGHESPADGDWCVRPDASADALACPVCTARVAAVAPGC